MIYLKGHYLPKLKCYQGRIYIHVLGVILSRTSDSFSVIWFMYSDSNNLAVVLGFLTLQDKYVYKIKYIYTRCETGQKSSPKACFPKACTNKLYMFRQCTYILYIFSFFLKRFLDWILLRDRPFNLKGGGYGFLFRSEFFIRTTQELEYFFSRI